jgi:predicted pyridoxine 5'-phosphate oxidase superfamily flavin-nucleotide-binding protein
MSDSPIYNRESRKLQKQFDTQRLAERFEQTIFRKHFKEEDRKFIEAQQMFFLATADDQGNPECSFKGGAPGFVSILSENTLAFPSYDGNGMFRSLGNININPSVGLLFIDFEKPHRLRVSGKATVNVDDPLMSSYPGAQMIVRVEVHQIFPNCQRYIPSVENLNASPYIPDEDGEAPTPGWKTETKFNDALPKSDPALSKKT